MEDGRNDKLGIYWCCQEEYIYFKGKILGGDDMMIKVIVSDSSLCSERKPAEEWVSIVLNATTSCVEIIKDIASLCAEHDKNMREDATLLLS